jgi:RNA polymerase sigma-70 factor (ECF subfamily)
MAPAPNANDSASALAAREAETAHDTALMQRLAAGEEAALGELYDRYGARVYGIALRVLNDGQKAEEVTQDTFLKVWNRPDAWDPARGRLVSWLLTVARYTALDRLRHDTRGLPPVMIDALETGDNDAAALLPDLDREAASWQDARTLRVLLEQMPREQRTLVEAAFFGGLTHSELAEITGLPLGTVKTRLRLGLQKLRRLWLEGHPPTPGGQPALDGSEV